MASANYVTPNMYRHLRACMICSYVQVYQKFVREGCPNCEMAVGLQGNSEKVDDCTSPVFEGLIALVDNTKSWVAKYQRLEGYVPGMYAVKVSGNLPEEVIQQLEDANIPYYPRDGSDDTGRAP